MNVTDETIKFIKKEWIGLVAILLMPLLAWVTCIILPKYLTIDVTTPLNPLYGIHTLMLAWLVILFMITFHKKSEVENDKE